MEDMMQKKFRSKRSLSPTSIAYKTDLSQIHHPLHEDGQLKLAHKFHSSGSTSERDDLVTSALRWAFKLASRSGHANRLNHHLEDLIQEANLGLLLAANRFNPSMNVAFTTYATFWIRAKVHAYVMSFGDNTVSLPQNVRRNIASLRRFIKEYERSESVSPTDEQIIAAGFNPVYLEALRYPPRMQSLESQSANHDHPDTEYLIDVLTKHEQPRHLHEQLIRSLAIKKVVLYLRENFKPKYAQAVIRHFGLDNEPAQTCASIGVDCGVSKESISNWVIKVKTDEKFRLFVAQLFDPIQYTPERCNPDVVDSIAWQKISTDSVLRAIGEYFEIAPNLLTDQGYSRMKKKYIRLLHLGEQKLSMQQSAMANFGKIQLMIFVICVRCALK